MYLSCLCHETHTQVKHLRRTLRTVSLYYMRVGAKQKYSHAFRVIARDCPALEKIKLGGFGCSTHGDELACAILAMARSCSQLKCFHCGSHLEYTTWALLARELTQLTDVRLFVDDPDVVTAFAVACHGLEKVHINDSFDGDRQAAKRSLDKLIRLQSGLRELELYDVHLNSTVASSLNRSHLVTLVIQDPIFTPAGIRNLNMPTLQTLSLSGDAGSFKLTGLASAQLPALTDLHLSCVNVPIDEWPEIFRNLPNLKELELPSMDIQTVPLDPDLPPPHLQVDCGEVAKALATNCTALRDLRFKGINEPGRDCLSLPHNLRLLAPLALDALTTVNIENMSDEMLRTIAETQPNLKELNFDIYDRSEEGGGPTDETLAFVLANCTRLHGLSFGDDPLPLITDAALVAAGRKLSARGGLLRGTRPHQAKERERNAARLFEI